MTPAVSARCGWQTSHGWKSSSTAWSNGIATASRSVQLPATGQVEVRIPVDHPHLEPGGVGDIGERGRRGLREGRLGLELELGRKLGLEFRRQLELGLGLRTVMRCLGTLGVAHRAGRETVLHRLVVRDRLGVQPDKFRARRAVIVGETVDDPDIGDVSEGAGRLEVGERGADRLQLRFAPSGSGSAPPPARVRPRRPARARARDGHQAQPRLRVHRWRTARSRPRPLGRAAPHGVQTGEFTAALAVVVREPVDDLHLRAGDLLDAIVGNRGRGRHILRRDLDDRRQEGRSRRPGSRPRPPGRTGRAGSPGR